MRTHHWLKPSAPLSPENVGEDEDQSRGWVKGQNPSSPSPNTGSLSSWGSEFIGHKFKGIPIIAPGLAIDYHQHLTGEETEAQGGKAAQDNNLEECS